MNKKKDIQKIYKTRGKEWQKLKESFISESLKRLINDTKNEQNIVFHSLYVKLVNLPDKEIMQYLTEETED